MIERIQKLEGKHGGGIKVYFDCPTCKLSYTPDYLATSAIHMTVKKDKE